MNQAVTKALRQDIFDAIRDELLSRDCDPRKAANTAEFLADAVLPAVMAHIEEDV